jgi:hypothetical protein
MSIFTSEIIEGRIPYSDLPRVPVSVFTAEFRDGVGVVHEDRKFINYDEIYWGETEENPIRAKGSTSAKIKELADSRRRGIDPTAPRPAISSCVITDVSGKTFRYRAENGTTRKKADMLNGNPAGGDVYDIVRFIAADGYSDKLNRFKWLHKENDNLPQGVNTIADLVLTCSELIQSGDLDKDEFEIRAFVEESAPNMPTQERNEVVRRVLKQEEVPTRTISWRDNECREWLTFKCVDNIEVDYCFPFHYFQDRVYSLMKQYHESGGSLQTRKVQTVVQHFETKGDCDEYILSQRESAQEKKWEEFRQICWSMAEYMLLNNQQLPFDKNQFFPQIKVGDNVDDPNRIVK